VSTSILHGRVWRQGGPRRRLLYCSEPAATSGRYHREGERGAWYASSMERAAWAEHIRHMSLGGVDPLLIRRRVGRAMLVGLRVLDLTDARACAALGIERGDLTGDDYARCQELADQARAAGFDGILAPSAAFAGEFTVVVFVHAMHKVTEEHSRVQHAPKTMRKFVRRILRKEPRP